MHQFGFKCLNTPCLFFESVTFVLISGFELVYGVAVQRISDRSQRESSKISTLRKVLVIIAGSGTGRGKGQALGEKRGTDHKVLMSSMSPSDKRQPIQPPSPHWEIWPEFFKCFLVNLEYGMKGTDSLWRKYNSGD